MDKKAFNFRGIVLTWTILTTTFFWTSTMRILMKPDISSWSIFQLGGKGMEGAFWFPPLIIIFSLFLFYLEGRGRIRLLFQLMLLGWHLLISIVVIYGSFQPDAKITFGTWGVSLSFYWLIPLFVLFLLLSFVMVYQERKGIHKVPQYDWRQINRKPLIIAVLIAPFALIFFQLGTGFNWLVKIAVASTVFQWIFLAESLGRPSLNKPEKQS